MGRPKRILVIGATSQIARATIGFLICPETELFLVGRDPEKLEAEQSHYRNRGVQRVGGMSAELSHFKEHASVIDAASQFLGGFDLAILAQGYLNSIKQEPLNYAFQEETIRFNFLSVASFFCLIAERMVEQRAGTIAVLGSVAGDRGKKRNFSYSVAKGALALYLQGQRNFLSDYQVQVCTIKPGTVATPLTERLGIRSLFMVGPEKVGKQIARGILSKKDVIYAPWYWRWIMVFVKLIPERVFKRLSL